MKIFLDTNVFYNNWFMKNANFKYLFHFLNNEEHELIISELVIQEVENIRNRDVRSSLAEIKKNINKLKKLNLSKVEYESDTLGLQEYKLLPLLDGKVESIHVFNYENIAHKEVVNRALINKKPFAEGEKGYRDTLIWLSFLNYVSEQKITDEEIIFITENSSDFFKVNKKEVTFHKDLINDFEVNGIEAKITPYTSLFDFVNSTIDQHDHAIDKVNMEWILEEYVESEGERYLENMTNSDLSEYLEDSIFDSKVKEILEIRVDVWEGLEDPKILQTTKMEDSDIYVSYSFNLRRVTLEIDIPEVDYIENQSALHKLFIDIDVSSGVATLTTYVRPYFDVSFIYNDRKNTLTDYEVSQLWLRK